MRSTTTLAKYIGEIDPSGGFQGTIAVVVTVLVAALVLVGILKLVRSRKR